MCVILITAEAKMTRILIFHTDTLQKKIGITDLKRFLAVKNEFIFPNINLAINCNNPVMFVSDLIIISLSGVT